MLKFQSNDKFLKNELIIIEKDVGEKTCIFNIQNNCGYEVSDVSKYIWEKINILNYGELVTNIANKYEVSNEVASNDLNEFLEQLLESELILLKGDM